MKHNTRCSCGHCAKVRKQKRFDYDHGIRLLQEATPVRNRLIELRDQEITPHEISMLTGISERTLLLIQSGRTKRVHRRTYKAIMDFDTTQVCQVRNERSIDSTPSRLRVQAMVALGYRQGWIANQLGRKHIGLDIGDRISRRRALDILELAIKVGDTPGPSRKAAVQARNKGWKKPAEYDEELFYDPNWDGTVPDSPLEPLSHSQEILEDYQFIVRTTGATIGEAAERLGISKSALEKIIARHKRLVA